MHTVLVVDDDIDVLATLEAMLTQAGKQVLGVSEASAALDVLRKNRVDVILTDYKLPEMDGLELLGKIQDLSPEVPVIVLTGYCSIDNYLNCMKLGAYDYVNKPVLSAELKRIVHSAIKKRDLFRANAAMLSGASSGTAYKVPEREPVSDD